LRQFQRFDFKKNTFSIAVEDGMKDGEILLGNTNHWRKTK